MDYLLYKQQIMSAFSGNKSFQVKTYKSDVLEEYGLKYRCYILILPNMEELLYIDFSGEFEEAVNKQITDIGKIPNNIFGSLDVMNKDEEDLDYMLILYIT